MDQTESAEDISTSSNYEPYEYSICQLCMHQGLVLLCRLQKRALQFFSIIPYIHQPIR